MKRAKKENKNDGKRQIKWIIDFNSDGKIEKQREREKGKWRERGI